MSPSCRFEFQYFLKQESHRKRKLILPILYIDTPGLEDTNDEIATEITKRQWIDWRDLRFTSPTSAKMTKSLESLAKQIRDLISDKVSAMKTSSKSESKFPPDSVVRASTREELSQSINPEQAKIPPSYLPLIVPSEKPEIEKNPLQITVLLRSTGDKERDKRRIKTIYGTLISFHGRDRFSFQLFEHGKGHLIDFPHDTTRVCTELLERLKKLMGKESWRVEEITFQ